MPSLSESIAFLYAAAMAPCANRSAAAAGTQHVGMRSRLATFAFDSHCVVLCCTTLPKQVTYRPIRISTQLCSVG
jgi:hypothetical protein